MAVTILLGFPTVALFIITFILVFLILRSRFTPPQGNLPPGPTGWPLLGYIPNMIAMMVFRGVPMPEVFDGLAKQYGPVYSMTLAGKRVVVANDYQTIKEMLHHPDMNDRPSFGKSVGELYGGTGVLYSSGDAWRDQRRFSLSVLRGFGVEKRSFEDQIATEAGHVLDVVHSFNGTPFDPSNLLVNAVSNIITSLTFGKRFEYSDPEFQRLQYLVDQRMESSGKEILALSLPFLLRLPFGPGYEIKTLLGELRQRFGDIVEEHRSTYDPENIRDFIDAYLNEIRKHQDHEGNESHFNSRNLVQTVEDLFVGGTQTTATTLRWALLYIIAFPSVQEKIQNELDRVVGRNRLPKLSDKPELPYLMATIHECQRYANILFILGARATSVETTLGSYTIPPRTVLLQNVWSVARDSSVWDDSLEFRPERFLDEDKHVIKRDEQLAFGAGRRSCMGENIAKMDLFIFLSHMLHRYTLKADENEPLNIKPKPGGLLKPFPYKIKAVER